MIFFQNQDSTYKFTFKYNKYYNPNANLPVDAGKKPQQLSGWLTSKTNAYSWVRWKWDIIMMMQELMLNKKMYKMFVLSSGARWI